MGELSNCAWETQGRNGDLERFCSRKVHMGHSEKPILSFRSWLRGTKIDKYIFHSISPFLTPHI